METKLFEVRAPATCIPVMAIKLGAVNEAEAWLLGKSGFGRDQIEWNRYYFVFPIEFDSVSVCDPSKQKIDELRVAHQYINEHFDELESGAVIDTDFITGRTTEPKKSDRFYGEE
jgi:hypothetical protein